MCQSWILVECPGVNISSSFILLFGSFIFYCQCTTQQFHNHCNNHRHHVIYLLVLVPQTNRIAACRSLRSLQDHHISLSHISSGLKWSRTYNESPECLSTTLIHMYWVLRWWGITPRWTAPGSSDDWGSPLFSLKQNLMKTCLLLLCNL